MLRVLFNTPGVRTRGPELIRFLRTAKGFSNVSSRMMALIFRGT